MVTKCRSSSTPYVDKNSDPTANLKLTQTLRLTLMLRLGSLGLDLGQHFVMFITIKRASDYTCIPGHNYRKFKQQQWQQKHHLEINMWEMVTIL